MTTAEAIQNGLISPNVSDRNMEAANIVDVVDDLARATRRVAAAITPNVSGGKDELGGHVESLTEAMMGVTGGLVRIAESISDLAQAVRERNEQ